MSETELDRPWNERPNSIEEALQAIVQQRIWEDETGEKSVGIFLSTQLFEDVMLRLVALEKAVYE